MDNKSNNSNETPALPTEGEWVYPRVPEFYRGKTIALTGGTGSLGQALIEKLLRCCGQLKKIILLIRTKRDVDPSDRLKKIMEADVFEALRETNPNFGEKLTCLPFDMEAEDLGLSDISKYILQSEVDILIHSAANMKFNEKFRVAYSTNVQAVRNLLKLCKGMAKLKALVHVSTAYSHCNRPSIDEKFYDCGVDYTELDSSLNCLTDEAIEKITPNLLGKRPNIYTLTKALGEDVIARESGDLPVSIVRPSMIVPAWKEPMPGWCTSLYGPTAFFVAYAKGVLKSAIADESKIGDLIPIDLVVNGILVVAMKTSCDFTDNPRSTKEDLGPEISFTEEGLADGEGGSGTLVNIRRNIPIYHFTSGKHNPLYIQDLVKFGKDWYKEYPLDPHRLPGVTVTCNRYVHKINTFFRQTIPAYMDDAVLTLLHRERKMRHINDKIISGLEVMEFFFTNEWQWSVSNTEALHSILCKEDQEMFDFDPRCFTWKEHFRRYVIGTRKYLVKQDMDAYPAARKAVERLRLQSFIVNAVGAVSLLLVAANNGMMESATELFMATYNMTSSLL